MIIIKEGKGFTLLEIIIAMGIFMFISVAMFGTLAVGRRSWLGGEALVRTQQEARFSIEKMVTELRVARAATVSADSRTVTFDFPIDADGNGFIDLVDGSTAMVYGAPDPEDSDGDGLFAWSGGSVDYQIDTVNMQIIRHARDAAGAIKDQRIIARNIDPVLSSFQAVSLNGVGVEIMGTGLTERAVIINVGTQINTVQGIQISPPFQASLSARANMRN